MCSSIGENMLGQSVTPTEGDEPPQFLLFRIFGQCATHIITIDDLGLEWQWTLTHEWHVIGNDRTESLNAMTAW